MKDCNNCKHHVQGAHPSTVKFTSHRPGTKPVTVSCDTCLRCSASGCFTHLPYHESVQPVAPEGPAPEAGTRFSQQPPMILPTDAKVRKHIPITSGVLDYFPRALAGVAFTSKVGNDQHNGKDSPLHWAKGKSTDHADCIQRHLADRDALDTDGVPHRFKLAWRALAELETWLEANPGMLDEVIQAYIEKGQA